MVVKGCAIIRWRLPDTKLGLMMRMIYDPYNRVNKTTALRRLKIL